MVGGRLHRLTCFSASRAELLLPLLLLWFRLHDAEASECPSVVHKQEGDSVVFSSCLPPEGVTYAVWKYKNDIVIEDLDESLPGPQFKDRTSLNRTNLSLTVRDLTLQDSGDYRFISETKDKQRERITISLHVHALLTPPILTVNSNWSALNQSCTVELDCSSTSDSGVTYNWTVRNQTHSGARLQYTIRPQEGGITFTCIIFDTIGEQDSSEKVVKCVNSTEEFLKAGNVTFWWTVVAVGACLLLIVIVVIIITVIYCCKQRRTATAGIDTEYADISDYVVDNKPTRLQFECDFVRDHRPNPVTPMPHSVYDKVQFSRVRKPPESPYQDI